MLKRLFILLLVLHFALLGKAQMPDPVQINETFHNTSLVTVIKILRRKYKLKFAYDHKLISPYRISQNIDKLPIADALVLILDETGLNYKVQGKTILILPPEDDPIKSFSSSPLSSDRSLTIKGVIRDAQTGESLPFANIRVMDFSYGTLSNVDGFFSLLGLPKQPITLEISYLGYMKKLVNVYPESADQLLDFTITSKAKVLDELIIEDNGSETIHSGEQISQLSINPSRLLSLPSFGEMDVFRTLQFLPGISGTDETSAGLVIRGSTPDQNLILFDGFSVFHIDHFFGVFSAFNPNAIKNIQVYKGAFEAKYGGRASSVIDITGKAGNSNEPSYGFGLNLISANAVLELPLSKKLSLFVAGRRSHTDVVQTGLYREIFDKVIIDNRDIINNLKDQDFEDIKPIFNFYDLNAKLTYRPNEKNVVAFSYYSGRDNLSIDAIQRFSDVIFDEANNIGYSSDINWNVNDESNWGNNGFSTRWGKQWGRNFYSNFNIAYSEYQSRQNNTERYNISIPVLEIDTLLIDRNQNLNNRLSDLSIRWDNEVKLGKNSQLGFGALLTSNRLNFNFEFNNENLVITDQKGTQMAYYIQNTFHPVKELQIDVGLRANRYNVFNRTYIEPRLSAIYSPLKNLNFKAAWGRHNQFLNRISFEENFYDINSTFWLLADGDLIPSIFSEHLVAGFSYESNKFLFDIEFYNKNTAGIIDFIPNVPLPDDQNNTQYLDIYLSGRSVAKGMDILIQKKTGKHTGWLSYSLSEVKNSFEDLNRGQPFAAKQDQRHEIKLVNMISLKNWDFSSTWVYGSGKPYSDPSNGSAIVILDSLSTSYIALDNINTERLPAYHRLDISAAYNFKIGKADSQLGLSIYNVYGRQNVKYRRFSALDLDEIATDSSYPESEPIYLSSDVALLGFTPNLFFNYRF